MIVNKLKYFFLPFLALVLIGCSAKVTEEDLIGGFWVATAGYKDGKRNGEPYGSSVITEGLEFKDDETVYVAAYDRDFKYELEKSKEGMMIRFIRTDLGLYLSYYIDKINEDEIGLRGDNELQEKESCYLERQKALD